MAQSPDEKKSEDVLSKDGLKEEEEETLKVQHLAKCMISLALNIDPTVKWQSSSKNAEMTVDYAYVAPPDGSNSATDAPSLATIRATTTIANFEPKDFYDFCSGNQSDEYAFYAKNDKMCEEIHPFQVIDEDQAIVYARFNPGGGIASWLVWNRDFCYVKRRLLFTDHVVDSLPNGDKLKEAMNFSQISLVLCTSLDEKDPNCKPVAKSHVRGDLKYAGYCFFKKKETDKDCMFVYVVNLDPKGWLPSKVVDITAPEQAKVALQVRKNIGMVREALLNRKKKQEQEQQKEQQKEETQLRLENTQLKTTLEQAQTKIQRLEKNDKKNYHQKYYKKERKRKRKRKQPKDPNAPKRPQSAYFFIFEFSSTNDERDTSKQKNH